MSSSRQPKPKAAKTKETNGRKRDQLILAELGSTFANSKSTSRYNHSQKSKKQIPKILSKIQKNVKDLKKYCSDASPNTSKKKHDKYQPPSHSVRTANDHTEESTASVEEIKRSYMSVYGKQTENIVELWKFYNSFLNKSRAGKTSITNHSASIPVRSELLPDYSLESRNDSGRGSALGSTDRIPLESINISDLLSNRPSDRRSKGEILEKVLQEQEQSRPLQRLGVKKKQTVKNVDFNLQAQLELAIPFQEEKETPKFQLEPIAIKEQAIKSEAQSQDKCKNTHWSFSNLIVGQNNVDSEVKTTITVETVEQDQNVEERVLKVSVNAGEQATNQRPPAMEQDRHFFKKIFQKNMLINKRKQELNAKLKKQKQKEMEAPADRPIEGLDDAILVQEDKPLFLQDQLPLSKQDISLLQKLDQLDKEIVPLSKSESENRLHEALKGLKKKKRFEESKFSVPQIPLKKMTKKPQILDIPFQQNHELFHARKPSPKKKVHQQRQQSNSSLLDCVIQAAQGQDSFLRNCEENYEKIQSQGFLDPIDL